MAKPTTTLVTVKQYAAHFGVSPDAVYEWCRRGMIETIPMYDSHTKHATWWIVWPQRRPKKKTGRPPVHPILHEKLPTVSACTSAANLRKVSNPGGPEK